MALLMPRPSKLIFPGTTPGVNLLHPAARGVMFSAVNTGNGGFTNLLSGVPGTITGTGFGSVSDPIIGPCNTFTPGGSTNIITFPYPVVNNTYTIMASICRFPTTAPAVSGHIVSNFNSSTFGTALLCASTNIPALVANNGTLQQTTAPVLTGKPVFFAASYNQNTLNANWAVSDLSNGNIWSGITAVGASGINTPSTGITIGNRQTDFIRSMGGSVATAMMAVSPSAFQLSLGDLVKWAADPWSFWYPNSFDLTYTLKSSTIADVLMAQILL